MIIYREFDTVEQIKKAFSIKTGIIEVTSENHVNFCENEDDAVTVSYTHLTLPTIYSV